MAGSLAWHRHMYEPGGLGTAPSAWPAEASLAGPADRPVVLVFAHPYCPCTPATLEQLSILAPEAQVSVVLSGPAVGLRDGAGPARRTAERMGWACVEDPAGLEARRFGAQVSGHVVAYGVDGGLLYVGGLTPGRGMTGPARGLLALRRALETNRRSSIQGQVFGCRIFDRCVDPAAPAAVVPIRCGS